MPLSRLKELGLVPVIRTGSETTALRAVEWLSEAGLSVFEVTLTTPGAIDIIGRLSQSEGLLIGAGTVLSEADCKSCLDAGARFVVSPAVVEGVAEICAGANTPCLLGAATPTEILSAWTTGASAVKIFPAGSLGGAGFLKALKAVFPEVPLVPTGGISIEEIPSYFEAGAAFIGMGSRLVDEKSLRDGDKAAIQSAAREATAAVASVRRDVS